MPIVEAHDRQSESERNPRCDQVTTVVGRYFDMRKFGLAIRFGELK